MGSLNNPPVDASEVVAGVVELATSAETVTGTDTTKATHPAGVAAAIAASAGGGVQKAVRSTSYEDVTRFVTSVGGGCSISKDSLGCYLLTGAGAGAYGKLYLAANKNGSAANETGSPFFSVTLSPDTLATDMDFFAGMGNMTVGAAGITFTSKHIGFKITRTASGVCELRATQADGVTENASAVLTTLVAQDHLDLCAQVNGTTSIDYYWRKNNSALSAAVNLTSNMPVDIGIALFAAAISNKNVATSAYVRLHGASYIR